MKCVGYRNTRLHCSYETVRDTPRNKTAVSAQIRPLWGKKRSSLRLERLKSVDLRFWFTYCQAETLLSRSLHETNRYKELHHWNTIFVWITGALYLSLDRVWKEKQEATATNCWQKFKTNGSRAEGIHSISVRKTLPSHGWKKDSGRVPIKRRLVSVSWQT
jgi:hypothetical protein